MIRNSFIFLEGIRARKEKIIWEQGIRNWDDFVKAEKIRGISAKRKGYYDRKIIEARKELFNLNSGYFYGRLNKGEEWRLYEFFKDESIFLDIETSGLDKDSYITIIGLFDGINTKTMVRNFNLDYKILQKELEKYKLIITFNGASFDLPFLKNKSKDLIPKIPHIDLKTMCSKAGLRGGLKEIEKRLGIKRENKIIERLYGGDVLRLWRMYLGSGDDHYLKLLIEYNEEDCINLKQIANIAYETLKKTCL
ncbi:MAG: ribonuclease H-like domain-containing protein [Candidatus Woesearchaeota archaeon]